MSRKKSYTPATEAKVTALIKKNAGEINALATMSLKELWLVGVLNHNRSINRLHGAKWTAAMCRKFLHEAGIDGGNSARTSSLDKAAKRLLQQHGVIFTKNEPKIEDPAKVRMAALAMLDRLEFSRPPKGISIIRYSASLNAARLALS